MSHNVIGIEIHIHELNQLIFDMFHYQFKIFNIKTVAMWQMGDGKTRNNGIAE